MGDVGIYNAYMTLSGAYDADVTRDERMARRTTCRIGGPAALFCHAHSLQALRKVLAVLAHEHVEWVILGKGSNILVSDGGYDGCVIELGREFSRISFGDDGIVTVGAAVPLSRLVRETLSHELAGLEFCIGIPGTLGGAVSMNAGTRRDWISRCIESVVTCDLHGMLHRLSADEVAWGYRTTSIDPASVILEATLRLRGGTKRDISARMNALIAHRQRTQPVGRLSCGSVFRNPAEGSAASLVEGCGLSGAREGAAQVSERHANFIINTGGATADDVIRLMTRMHDAVMDTYGTDLTPEVKFLGFGA